jgi:hypothetical protein
MPVDIGSIKRNDQIAGAAAVLAFIFALIPGVVTASLNGDLKEAAEAAGADTSEGINLWHSYGVLAGLLLLVGIAGLVAAILNRAELQAVPVRWVTTGIFGLATLLVLLYALTYDGGAPGGVGSAVDIGPGIVGWILLVLCVVTTVFVALGAQESGEQLPGRRQQAGPASPTPPPAA